MDFSVNIIYAPANENLLKQIMFWLLHYSWGNLKVAVRVEKFNDFWSFLFCVRVLRTPLSGLADKCASNKMVKDNNLLVKPCCLSFSASSTDTHKSTKSADIKCTRKQIRKIREMFSQVIRHSVGVWILTRSDLSTRAPRIKSGWKA